VVVPLRGSVEFNGDIAQYTPATCGFDSFQYRVQDNNGAQSFAFVYVIAGNGQTVDTDNDGVTDACDVCSGFDDKIDIDRDGEKKNKMDFGEETF
jgi:hypothetical protein